MSIEKEPELYDARAALWYALPQGASTFSKCKRCDNRARGGALCPDCAEANLAKVIGYEPASQYYSAIRRLRMLERQQIEIIRKLP